MASFIDQKRKELKQILCDLNALELEKKSGLFAGMLTGEALSMFVSNAEEKVLELTQVASKLEEEIKALEEEMKREKTKVEISRISGVSKEVVERYRVVLSAYEDGFQLQVSEEDVHRLTFNVCYPDYCDASGSYNLTYSFSDASFAGEAVMKRKIGLERVARYFATHPEKLEILDLLKVTDAYLKLYKKCPSYWSGADGPVTLAVLHSLIKD